MHESNFIVAGTCLAIFSCNVWPRKTWHPLALGTLVEAIGITLIAASLSWGRRSTIFGMLVLTGVGTGVRLMPGVLHGIGYHRDHISSVVSLVLLAQALGGTLASTIMLNIFNNQMQAAGIDLDHGPISSVSSISQIHGLSHHEQAFVRGKAKDAIVVAFYGISAFMWLGLVSMAFMGNVDIKKDSKRDEPSPDDAENAAHLTHGAYLASCFRRHMVSDHAKTLNENEAKV